MTVDVTEAKTQARALLASPDRETRFEGAAQLHEAAWAELQALDDPTREPPTPEDYIAALAEAASCALDAFDPVGGQTIWQHTVRQARRLSVPLTLRESYIALKARTDQTLAAYRRAAAESPPKLREVMTVGDFGALGQIDRRRASAWLETALPRFIGTGLLWGLSGVIAFYDERYERAWRDFGRVERLPPVQASFAARRIYMAEQGLAPPDEGAALLGQVRREREARADDEADPPRIP